MDYFKDNPRIKCPSCEGTFRVKGIDNKGQDRIYDKCMACAKKEWMDRKIKK